MRKKVIYNLIPYLCLSAFPIYVILANKAHLIPHISYYNVPLHSAIECFGFVVSFVVSAVIILREKVKSFGWEAPVVSGLLAIGILDIFHAVVFPGGNFVLLKSIGTLIGGCGFILVFLPSKIWKTPLQISVVSLFVAVSLAIGFLLEMNLLKIPAAFDRYGAFSHFVVDINLIGGLLLLAASVRFLIYYIRNGTYETIMYASICLLLGFSGITFSESKIWDEIWWMWHGMRILAYVLLCVYLWWAYSKDTNYLKRILENSSRLNNELFRSKYELLQAQKVAKIGSWIWEPSSNVIEVSENMCELFNLDMVDKEKQAFNDFLKRIDVEDRDRVRDVMSEALDKEEGFAVDFRSKSGDGREMMIRSIGEFVKYSGEIPVRMFGIDQDITEDKKREEIILKQKEDLARSNEDLEQFAYVASHDLQEPLRVISSYTQLIGLRYKEKLDKDGKVFIDFTFDAVHRMRTLINNLLEFARIGSANRKIEEVDCGVVANVAINMLEILIEDNGATVNCEHLPKVIGDRTHLTRLFQNLIENGIKFHGDEKPVVNVSAVERENDFLFSVSDNGIGIDMKYKDKVYKIFQYLNPKSQYKGTGIGLSICKRIVDLHGGTIWFESEPGKGTVFLFTIPKKSNPE